MKITLSALLLFLFVGCSDDTTTQNKAVAEQKTPQVEQPKEQVQTIVQEETKPEIVVKQKTEVVVKVEPKPEPKAEAKVEQKTAPKPALTTKQEVKQEVKQEIVEAKQEVKKEIAAVAKDPATLYKACTTCHGADAGKSALNKSQIIKGWSAQKIADALNGYKDGTYGGASKALMKGQVAKLSKEDIESLSNYIAKF